MDASFESKETDGRPVVLEQKERVRRFGLECIGPAGDGIVFKAGHWTPGGEYVQKLIVRNVSTSVKKFKYKLPSTRYFSLAYPEVIILSPGMFRELDVIFRPVEYNPYDDTIYIQMVEGVGSGGFHVSVRATIDKLILTSPFGLDLGYCPTHQTTSVVFQLTNSGEVDAPFRWQQTYPFAIEPEQGCIPVGQSLDIRVSIYPTDASVFVSAVTCIVGEGVHAIIPEPVITTRISAIGKYTYIVVSEDVVDFGAVLSGTQPDAIKREIVLRNNSVVPAEFELIRHESDTDEVFNISPRSGVLPPQSDVPVVIKYHALASGCFSLDRYTFKTPGGCTTQLTLQGLSVPSQITNFKETSGVDMSLTAPTGSPADAINFRDIEVGKTETRVMFLRNDSKKDSAFNILCGGNGIFKVSPRQGIIPAQFQQFPITLTFTPPRPMNYYRRVFVLIGDNLPLLYDVMGSGFIRAKGEIKEQRPAPLRFAHVQAYRNRLVQGLGGLSPPELDDMVAQGSGDPAFFAQVGRIGTRALAVTSLQSPLTRTGEATRVAVAAAHELFIEDTDSSSRDVTINKMELNFGFTPHQSSSDSQTLALTNHTRGKVCVVWELPHEADANLLCAFEIDPPTFEIAPGQSEKCRVTFRPQQSNRNFLSELEAFVYFKNQRTFRLVNDNTLTPPWCLCVKASGHTFSSGQLLATVKLTGSNVRRGKLIFPTCYEGESTYQTFMLRNTSNLPSIFRFELGFGDGVASVSSSSLTRGGGGDFGSTGNSSSDVFSLTPMSGEVAAEGFVLISVRFLPTASRKYTQLIKCIVNGDLGGKLLVEGNASLPFAYFPDVLPAGVSPGNRGTGGVSAPPQFIPRGFQGSFFLQPTHVGLSTSRQLLLKNGSRLPLRFRLQLPPEAAGIVSISPAKGLLRGNETVAIIVAFAPKSASRQVFKLRAKVYPVGGRPQRVLDARQPMSVAPPECLQSLSMYIVAPGEIGAVLFSPNRLAIDVRLVYTKESRDIFLENTSDSDLQYEIHYQEDFQADLGGSTEQPKQVSELRLLTKESTGPSDLNSLFCEAPTGKLSARSRLRVVFTYQPIRAGLFDFHIFCRLKAVDPISGRELMLPNEEAALLRTHGSTVTFPLVSSITSRASFPRLIIDDIRVVDDPLVADTEHLWRQFNLAPLNHELSLPLTDEELKLNGSVSTDVSLFKKYAFEFIPGVVGSPVQTIYLRVRNSGFLTTTFHMHLPNEKQLDLEQWCDEDEPSEELNKIISIIEEIKCFTISPAYATLLPGASCDLVLSYSHSSLKYGGVHGLPVHVKLEQGKQFMLELNGRTLPHPGAYFAPSDGGRSEQKLITDITNREAAPSTDIMLSACLGHDRVRHMVPVPIGLPPHECPRQRIEIFNVSECDAAYDVSLASLEALNADNYDSPVVRISNPSGVISARNSTFLDIYFCPLEAREYEFSLSISYTQMSDSLVAVDHGFDPATPGLNKSKTSLVSAAGAASPAATWGGGSKIKTGGKAARGVGGGSDRQLHTLSFTIRARGYDSRVGAPVPLGEDAVGGCPGSEQLVRFPAQLAFLSGDLLDFDMVPQGCGTNRLLVLRSLTTESEIEFSVDDVGPSGTRASALVAEGLLSVFPMSGRLAPGEQVVLDFRFEANSKPIFAAERLKIMVREIVKGQQKRRNANKNTKAMSRILSRKTHSVEHESVVKRTTTARVAQLQSTAITGGRSASMPTTVNARGQLLTSFRAESATTQHNVSREASLMGGGGGGGITFEQEGTLPSTLREGSTGAGPRNSRPGGGLEGEFSASGIQSKGSGSPDRGSLRTPESQGSRLSRNRDRDEHTPAPLRGLQTTLLVRIRAQVLPYETAAALMGRGPSLGLLERFVPPASLAFIPPVPLNIIYGKPDPPAFESKNKMLQFAVDAPRHSEVRAVEEDVLFSLFRSILSSTAVTEDLRECLGMPPAAAANPKSHAAATVRAAAKSPAKLGVYFAEISTSPAAHRALAAGAASASTAAALSQTNETMPLLVLPPRRLGADVLKPAADSSCVVGPSGSPYSPTKRHREEQRLQREEALISNTRVALATPGFADLAGEILRNTIFNLMQEAVHDEFSVFSDPITFLIPKNN